eukprot:160659-Amphidinium_carterae.1
MYGSDEPASGDEDTFGYPDDVGRDSHANATEKIIAADYANLRDWIRKEISAARDVFHWQDPHH